MSGFSSKYFLIFSLNLGRSSILKVAPEAAKWPPADASSNPLIPALRSIAMSIFLFVFLALTDIFSLLFGDCRVFWRYRRESIRSFFSVPILLDFELLIESF